MADDDDRDAGADPHDPAGADGDSDGLPGDAGPRLGRGSDPISDAGDQAIAGARPDRSERQSEAEIHADRPATPDRLGGGAAHAGAAGIGVGTGAAPITPPGAPAAGAAPISAQPGADGQSIEAPGEFAGGGPVGGPESRFHRGGAPIAVLGGVFSGGLPLGGPVSQIFRSSAPTPNVLYLSTLSPSGPIGAFAIGIPGAPLAPRQFGAGGVSIEAPPLYTGGTPVGGPASRFNIGGAPIAVLGGVFGDGLPIGGPVTQIFRGGSAPTPNTLFVSTLSPSGPIGSFLIGSQGGPIGALTLGGGGMPIGAPPAVLQAAASIQPRTAAVVGPPPPSGHARASAISSPAAAGAAPAIGG